MNPEERLLETAKQRLDDSYTSLVLLIQSGPIPGSGEVYKEATLVRAQALENGSLEEIEQAYIDMEEMMVMLDESR